MRRHLPTTGIVLLGLGLLWQFWSDPTEGEHAPIAQATPQKSEPAPTLPHAAPDPLYELGDVTAEPDEGAIDPLAETQGTVWFTVENDDGDPVEKWRVFSQDCQVSWSYKLIDTPLLLPEGECTFLAYRADGALSAQSGKFTVAIEAGVDHDVVLVVPTQRTGGLGVQIREHDMGIEVMRVMPNTPAADLGLQRGDLIVEVDGIETVDLELDDFISTMTGPEGSEVDFALAYEGDTGLVIEDVTLVRTFLESPGDPGRRGAEFTGRALGAVDNLQN